MKGACERCTPPLPQGTADPARLQPRIRPTSRARSPLSTPSSHICPSVSCRILREVFPPVSSSLEISLPRCMFTKLWPSPPPPPPPAASCRFCNRNRRSTFSSTASPREIRLYLQAKQTLIPINQNSAVRLRKYPQNYKITFFVKGKLSLFQAIWGPFMEHIENMDMRGDGDELWWQLVS